MNLREYLRNEWSKYIRPLMVKDKCERCGCESDLHLHHIDRFHNLLVETLEELQLQELDIEFYDEMELKQISNFMLAKQIKSEYKTLCKSCHVSLHNKEKHSDEYKNNYYNPNGGYIMINEEEILKLNIDNALFLRFLIICCNCNYNGFLSDKKRLLEIVNIAESTFLNNILNLKSSRTANTINELEKLGLIKIEDRKIIINRKYASKGFNNYKRSTKIFLNTFTTLYNSIEPREHKIFGSVILKYMDNPERLTFLDVLPTKSNSSKLKAFLLRNGCFCKSHKINIVINPNLIYRGFLDYSYKEIISNYEYLNNKYMEN